MNLEEGIDLMKVVKAFEEWDGDRFPYEKAEAASELASQVRSYIEDEAELGGWYTELEEAIGEAEPDKGMEEAEPPGAYERDGDLYTGRWRVHLVHEGERYGATGSLVYGDEIQSWDGKHVNDCQEHGHGLPLVEFYDTAQDSAKFPEGQFVSRYYMSTLLGMDDPRHSIGDMDALGLDGGVPAWTVGGSELQEVYRFLCDERDAQEAADLIREEKAPQSHEASRTAGVSLKGIAKEVRGSAQALSEHEGFSPKDAAKESRACARELAEDDKKKSENNGNTDNHGYNLER